MDIILDSSIYIADVWLRSQRSRGLIEYLTKTRGSLVLPEVVEHEVRAHVRRTLTGAVEALENAARAAERLGVRGIPAMDAAALLEASYQSWSEAFMRALPPGVSSPSSRTVGGRL